MTDIVFIGAVGRSGTTLLERVLSTAGGTIAVGEVVHLWQRGVRWDEPCGCGEKFSACSFWKAVGDRAFGGWEALSIESVEADQRIVDRNRCIPYLILPQTAPRTFREAHSRYVHVLDQLYTAIAEIAAESGSCANVIVDSSKHPSYLFLLRALPHHSVHLLHVIRDPRGVAHSWARIVTRPEGGAPMERLGTVKAIARWTGHNLLFQVAGWLRMPRRRLAYEHFTNEPLSLGRCVDDLLGHQTETPLAVDGTAVTVGVDHTVSGNPVRFKVGTLTIRSDESWRRDMSTTRRCIIGALTTPLRQVYAR